MPAAAPTELPDIQSTPDGRQIAIDQVGVCDLTYPIVVLDRQNQKQQCAARLSLSVSLPHHFKGTHMSRFLEVLAEHPYPPNEGSSANIIKIEDELFHSAVIY